MVARFMALMVAFLGPQTSTTFLLMVEKDNKEKGSEFSFTSTFHEATIDSIVKAKELCNGTPV